MRASPSTTRTSRSLLVAVTSAALPGATCKRRPLASDNQRTRAAALHEHAAVKHLKTIDGMKRHARVFVELQRAAVRQCDLGAPHRDVHLVAGEQHQPDRALAGPPSRPKAASARSRRSSPMSSERRRCKAVQPRDRSLDVREMANGRLGKQRGGEKQAKANRQNETNCRNEHGRHNFRQAQVAKPQYTSDFLTPAGSREPGSAR